MSILCHLPERDCKYRAFSFDGKTFSVLFGENVVFRPRPGLFPRPWEGASPGLAKAESRRVRAACLRRFGRVSMETGLKSASGCPAPPRRRTCLFVRMLPWAVSTKVVV